VAPSSRYGSWRTRITTLLRELYGAFMTCLGLGVRISRVKADDAWVSGRLRLVSVHSSSRAGDRAWAPAPRHRGRHGQDAQRRGDNVLRQSAVCVIFPGAELRDTTGSASATTLPPWCAAGAALPPPRVQGRTLPCRCAPAPAPHGCQAVEGPAVTRRHGRGARARPRETPA
jgi:hypothetical protein